jgi:hypothetical protein
LRRENRPGRQRTCAPRSSSGMTSAPQSPSCVLATEPTNPSRASSVWNRAVRHGPQSIDGPLTGGFLGCAYAHRRTAVANEYRASRDLFLALKFFNRRLAVHHHGLHPPIGSGDGREDARAGLLSNPPDSVPSPARRSRSASRITSSTVSFLRAVVRYTEKGGVLTIEIKRCFT